MSCLSCSSPQSYHSSGTRYTKNQSLQIVSRTTSHNANIGATGNNNTSQQRRRIRRRDNLQNDNILPNILPNIKTDKQIYEGTVNTNEMIKHTKDIETVNQLNMISGNEYDILRKTISTIGSENPSWSRIEHEHEHEHQHQGTVNKTIEPLSNNNIIEENAEIVENAEIEDIIEKSIQ
jgi:hypothetical protein